MIHLSMSLISQAATTEVPLSDVFSAALSFIGGLKGASALAISVGVVQLLMKIMDSSLGSFTGKWKLIAVYGLSVIATILASLVSGSSILTAIMSGSVLSAIQVFGHQIYSVFFEKKTA